MSNDDVGGVAIDVVWPRAGIIECLLGGGEG